MTDASAPARFDWRVTALYALSIAGFLCGAVLYAAKPDTAPAPDAPIDTSDVILIVSWATLVIAAALTAARAWRTTHH